MMFRCARRARDRHPDFESDQQQPVYCPQCVLAGLVEPRERATVVRPSTQARDKEMQR